MSLTICTGWSPAGYVEYGRRFAESFAKHWPPSVNLVVYGEQPCALPRGEFRLLSSIPGCVDFILKHRRTRVYNGLVPMATWKQREFSEGYSYRYDAVKFCRQGFIPLDAMMRTNDDFVCWLDGDVVTFRDVPEGFIEGLMPKGGEVAYLGREPKHPDIAFQLYRVGGDASYGTAYRFREFYTTDTVFDLPEWHSAYVWKESARVFKGPKLCDLTPGGSGHVWFQSPLGDYLDHLKGARKERGRSKERKL
jgi:hypothetical protein